MGNGPTWSHRCGSEKSSTKIPMERSIAEKVPGLAGLHEFYNDLSNMAEG
jgi:GTP1/Obg family GTP-binding protein